MIRISGSRNSARQHAIRRGITLIEVLVATAIFLGALTAVLGIINLGHESRLSARLEAEAVVRCETVMGEYIAGIREMVAAKEQFDDDDRWRLTTSVEDADGESLLKIVVTIEHMAGEEANAYFQLTRYIRDPQLFLDAALASEESE